MAFGDNPTTLGNSKPEAPEHEQSTTSRLLADASEFTSEAGKSLVYSALQSPLLGAAQLVDNATGTHLAEHVQFMDAPKEAAFGSLDWHAQQIGSGLGVAADFLVVHKTVGAVSSKLVGPTENLSAVSAIGRSALTGAIYQGAFTPSNGQGGEFWTNRVENAATGAATFAAMTGAQLGLRSMVGTAAAESSIAAKFLKSDVALGTVAGIPAGVVQAETSSLLHGNGFSSTPDNLKSAYSFLVAGGAIGALHGFAPLMAKGATEARADSRPASEVPAEVSSKPVSEPSERDILDKIQQRLVTDSHWDHAISKSSDLHDALSIKTNKYDLVRSYKEEIESTARTKVRIAKQIAGSDNSEYVDMPATVYKFKGRPTQLIVPTADWSKLIDTMEFRDIAEGLDGPTREKFDQRMKKTLSLSTDPNVAGKGYFDVISPTQLVKFLDELPDQSKIKRLIVWPDSVSTAMADALPTGDVNLYNVGKNDASDVRMALFHEWAHEVDFGDTKNAFELAAKLEANGYFAREYAKKNKMEDLAVHLGEEVLSPDADHFFAFTDQAPIRAVILGDMLYQRLLAAEKQGLKSPYHDEFMRRAAYISAQTMPVAREAIAQKLTGSREEATDAFNLLKHLQKYNPELASELTDQATLQKLGNFSAREAVSMSMEKQLKRAELGKWLDDMLVDRHSTDPEARETANQAVADAIRLGKLTYPLHEDIEADLKAGGDKTSYALEWLQNHPDTADQFFASNIEGLRDVALNSENQDQSALALSQYLRLLNSYGSEQNPATLDLVARARQLLSGDISDKNGELLIDNLFPKGSEHAAYASSELRDLLPLAYDAYAFGFPETTKAALSAAAEVRDAGVRFDAMRTMAGLAKSGFISMDKAGLYVGQLMDGMTEAEQTMIAKQAFRLFQANQRQSILNYARKGVRNPSRETYQALNDAHEDVAIEDRASYSFTDRRPAGVKFNRAKTRTEFTRELDTAEQ